MREIPQRELRNEITKVLRDVAAGESVRVTVRGKPVAELTPVRSDLEPTRFVPWHDLKRAFGGLELDDRFAGDLLRDIAEAVDQAPRDAFPR